MAARAWRVRHEGPVCDSLLVVIAACIIVMCYAGQLLSAGQGDGRFAVTMTFQPEGRCLECVEQKV